MIVGVAVLVGVIVFVGVIVLVGVSEIVGVIVGVIDGVWVGVEVGVTQEVNVPALYVILFTGFGDVYPVIWTSVICPLYDKGSTNILFSSNDCIDTE